MKLNKKGVWFIPVANIGFMVTMAVIGGIIALGAHNKITGNTHVNEAPPCVGQSALYNSNCPKN